MAWADPVKYYLIRDVDAKGRYVFWSQTFGWVEAYRADRFTHCDYEKMDTPPGNHPEWLRITR